jgi:hypothetical protein
MIGLLNTTTRQSGGLPDCVLNRPCEVSGRGVSSREDTNYGPILPNLAPCFDAVTWRFTGPGGPCPLDPGIQLDVPTWTKVANPHARSPLGEPPRTTWNATLQPTEPALTWYRVATGPAGSIDCRAEASYGAPVELPDGLMFDDSLPTSEGRHLACFLAGPTARVGPGWQSSGEPSVLNTWIDLTPPTGEIQLDVREDPNAWFVEPLFDPPEYSVFMWKWGAADATNCAEPGGYMPHRRIPAPLPREDAPTRLCVVGYDDANNPSVPLDRVFG